MIEGPIVLISASVRMVMGLYMYPDEHYAKSKGLVLHEHNLDSDSSACGSQKGHTSKARAMTFVFGCKSTTCSALGIIYSERDGFSRGVSFFLTCGIQHRFWLRDEAYIYTTDSDGSGERLYPLPHLLVSEAAPPDSLTRKYQMKKC